MGAPQQSLPKVWQSRDHDLDPLLAARVYSIYKTRTKCSRQAPLSSLGVPFFSLKAPLQDTTNKQRASAPQLLRGALFQFEKALEPGEKRAPLLTCILLSIATAVASLQRRRPPITTVIFPRS